MPPGPPGPPKSRRCHFFDSQGHRLYLHGELGCPRSSGTCHFVHPSDPEWDTVGRGDSRRFSDDLSARRTPTSPSRGRERRRSRSRSFDRHHRTPPRSPVRHHSPSRRDRDGHPPNHHDRDLRPPRPQPSKTLDSDRKPELLPNTAACHTNSHDRPASIAPLKGTVTTTSSSSSVMPKPSPKPSPEIPSKPFDSAVSQVLPPPPIQNLATPSGDAIASEQRRAVWEKRIALMADATKEYMELEKLEKDLQTRRNHVQLPAFAAFPSDLRVEFQNNLARAESAYEKKKDSFGGVINKLSETDFWPVVPQQNAQDLEAKLKGAKTMLGGLADRVGQLHKRIEGLQGQRVGGPSATQSSPNDDGAISSNSGGSVHTNKRRRLSINGGYEATSEDISGDVESIKNTIRDIEDRLHEVENDITQHSCHVMEQLEVKIEEKIEEMARNADISSLMEVRLGPQTSQTIQAFSESFAQADREIGELAQEVAELLPKLDLLQRDNDLFKEEEAASKELLVQLVKADQQNAQALTRLQNEAKLLHNAFAAHAKRAIRPPLPLTHTPKPFMDHIKRSIEKQVHDEILPMLTATRTDVERLAKARETELYEKLVGDKPDQGSKLSQLVLAWIECHPEFVPQMLAAAASSVRSSGADGVGSSRAST